MDESGCFGLPHFIVCEIFGSGICSFRLKIEQHPGGLPAARYIKFAAHCTKAFIDRVDRKVQCAGSRFRIMPACNQTQGLLFFVGEAV